MEQQSARYTPLVTYVERVQRQIGATAAALYVRRRGETVLEWYNGAGLNAASRFHVHSVRKSYIGLALALAQEDGKIGSLDDPVSNYLHEAPALLANTTLRHLVTHTQGLNTRHDGTLVRDHPPGEGWQYVNTGIDLLLDLIRQQTGQSVSELLQARILEPHGFCETSWETEASPLLVPDVYNDGVERLQFTPDRNLYVSARELAKWGRLHLAQEGVFGRTTTVQTPALLDEDLPRNGYCWYVQDDPCGRTEIGEFVPRGSFQILGVNGCAVLVIPELDVVAVRMYNKIGNPPRYDYLRDIRDFGNLVTQLS
jgi:CubicO group peptidase (beta-lactamase class C family)